MDETKRLLFTDNMTAAVQSTPTQGVVADEFEEIYQKNERTRKLDDRKQDLSQCTQVLKQMNITSKKDLRAAQLKFHTDKNNTHDPETENTIRRLNTCHNVSDAALAKLQQEGEAKTEEQHNGNVGRSPPDTNTRTHEDPDPSYVTDQPAETVPPTARPHAAPAQQQRAAEWPALALPLAVVRAAWGRVTQSQKVLPKKASLPQPTCAQRPSLRTALVEPPRRAWPAFLWIGGGFALLLLVLWWLYPRRP